MNINLVLGQYVNATTCFGKWPDIVVNILTVCFLKQRRCKYHVSGSFEGKSVILPSGKLPLCVPAAMLIYLATQWSEFVKGHLFHISMQIIFLFILYLI